MPEITFCKDCMHYLRTGYGHNKKCYRPCKGGNGGLKMKPYDYCSYGTTWEEYDAIKDTITKHDAVKVSDEVISYLAKRLREPISEEERANTLFAVTILIRARGGYTNADL